MKLSASLEDYLEAIYLISRKKGAARSKEIMKHLTVKGSSVTEALQLLADKKLVNYAPYETITLTSSGETVALKVLLRHETLRDFFVEVLDIDAKLADEGACKTEHIISADIIERMIKYTTYIKEKCKARGCDRAACFKEYLREEENGLKAEALQEDVNSSTPTPTHTDRPSPRGVTVDHRKRSAS